MISITGSIHELAYLSRWCERMEAVDKCEFCPFKSYLTIKANDPCVVPLEDLYVVQPDENEEVITNGNPTHNS